MHKLHLPILLIAVCLSLSACVGTRKTGDTRAPEDKYQVVVTGSGGKNVVSFPEGAPDRMVRKSVQKFVDRVFQLKEGERTTFSFPYPPTDVCLPANAATVILGLPPIPDFPPPIPSIRFFAKLPPPRYPFRERQQGMIGEVLVEITVGANHAVSKWLILRATTPGYAREVATSLSRPALAADVAPGTYTFRVIFAGDRDVPGFAGSFIIWTDGFGKP